jgi:hypothetical protein
MGHRSLYKRERFLEREEEKSNRNTYKQFLHRLLFKRIKIFKKSERRTATGEKNKNGSGQKYALKRKPFP